MKNLLIFLFISLFLPVQHLNAAKSVWDGKKSDTSWYDENAQEYHITSAAQFKGFADLVSYNNCSFEGKSIYLDCDIDLNNQPWSPIGLHSGKPFSGIFDGQNHYISNLYINSQQFEYPDMKDNVGLFGYAVKATIKNIGVQGNLDIYSGKYIGGIAAFVNNIENAYSDIKIKMYNSVSSSFIGTVVSYAENGKNIYSIGEISFSEYYLGMISNSSLGGISGRCTNISECYSDVELYINIIGSNSEHIGGISGTSSRISNAIFTGGISVSNYNCTSDNFIPNTGGISGRVDNGDHLISAPRFMTYGRGLAAAKSVVVPKVSNATITDTYYVNTWATNLEVYGVSIPESDLKSGNPISGFETSIWEFNENEYPTIKSLKELIPKPTYTVSYYVDGVLYQVDEYKEGETVIPPVDPVKEGYSFKGWDYIPPFISGNSWIVNGSFTINSYTITYMIDDEVYKTTTQEYSTYIYPPTAFPLKQGYLFNWGEYPDRVPAHDITIVGYYTEDNYEFVDLGLPSGLMWATKNIGATCPEDYGYYFSWGETHIKESYYWGTYSYCEGSENNLTKYCYSSEFGMVDDKCILDEDDDAATKNWGKPWRLPTLAEMMELYTNCSWSLASLNGTQGCYITGPNGNSIFIPKAGYKQYKTTFHKGEESYIMSSTLYKEDNDNHPDYGYLVFCDASSYGIAGSERSFGYSVRPVTATDPSGITNQNIDRLQTIEHIYDLQGRKINQFKKGINIIRMKDGKSKKILVK